VPHDFSTNFVRGQVRDGPPQANRYQSEEGRRRYGQRFATVESMFGNSNIRHNKGLNRFTLRGRHKVDTQCKLSCMVHNIEKLAHRGYGP
jgi:hypothetical protein